MKEESKLTLTGSQTKAFKFFNEHGYLVVEAPRKSGKTTLLKTIIDSNKDKKIGIYCLSYIMFRKSYDGIPNCFYVECKDAEIGQDFNLIIGDEVLIEPRQEQMVACALTKRYITLRWGNDLINEKEMDFIKKTLTSEKFEVEFGQYDA